MDGFRNWSGTVRIEGAEPAKPASLDALAAFVRDAARAGATVRPVGSAHSGMPFWQDGDRLVSLAALAGPRDPQGDEPCFSGGTGLWEIGPWLAERGRALPNLGDIDRQRLAGALATGTHGTGATLRNLSAGITRLDVMGPDGEVRTLDGGDALDAARVSLGLLGVVTHATLETVPLYGLHERNRVETTDACLDALDARVDAHRHFEFWWLPHDDSCIAKTLDAIEAPAAPRLDEIPFGKEGERWGLAHQVLPSARELRFHEIEYALPAERGVACFRALRAAIRAEFPGLFWPVEFRRVAGDAAWLSPTQGAPVATLSVHQGEGQEWRALFERVEPILRAHGGRPHWGKWHSLAAAELAPLYPRLGGFAALCRQRDPGGVFRNAWLESLLPGAPA